MSETFTYRLRLRFPSSNTPHYIVRNKSGTVSYISASETPLALSNLITGDAAAVRFMLEDAAEASFAAKHLRAVLAEQYKNNLPIMPKVEVL